MNAKGLKDFVSGKLYKWTGTGSYAGREELYLIADKEEFILIARTGEKTGADLDKRFPVENLRAFTVGKLEEVPHKDLPLFVNWDVSDEFMKLLKG